MNQAETKRCKYILYAHLHMELADILHMLLLMTNTFRRIQIATDKAVSNGCQLESVANHIFQMSLVLHIREESEKYNSYITP